jgi:hypothetical protein
MSVSSAFDEASAIEALGSNSIVKIQQLADAISRSVEEQPMSRCPLIVGARFFAAIVAALNSSDKSHETLTVFFALITAVFPRLSEEQRISFTDEGLAFSLMELLAIRDQEVLHIVLDLITVLSPQSDYLCDAFFTLDFYDQLIDIANKGTNADLQIAAAQSIFKLYGDHDRILSTILKDSLPKLVTLLNLPSKLAVTFILKALTEVTNQRCSLTYVLFDCKVVEQIVNMLDDDELRSSVLTVIGNLCLSSREHVKKLMSLGLGKKLLALTETEYAADAYWALSNLIERIPDLWSNEEVDEKRVGPIIDSVLAKVANGSSQVKKEATFFLASVIMFVSRSYLLVFLRADVLALFVKGLTVSADVVVQLRFLDVFLRFCIHVQHSEATFTVFKQLIASSGLFDVLEVLKKGNEPMLLAKAQEIEEQLDELSKTHQT